MIDEKVLITREAEVQAEVVKRLQGIKRRADMKFEKRCFNCRKYCDRHTSERCDRCDDNFNLWLPPYWLEEWLNSFDISSATKCFEAVNLLKQRLEDVHDIND